MDSTQKLPAVIIFFAWTALILMLGFLLIIAKAMLVPLALAILLAFLLKPIVNFFERKAKFPSVVAILIPVLSALAIIVFSGYFIGLQVNSFIGDTPNIQKSVSTKVTDLQHELESIIHVSQKQQNEFFNKYLSKWVEGSNNMIKKAASATMSTIVTVGLLPVYTFFLLFFRHKFYDFIIASTKTYGSFDANHIVYEISSVTQKYLSGVITVVLILCVLNSTGLYIVGAKYALLLGVISAVINFIPYFGTLIGGAVALITSLFLQSDTGVALGIIILFIIIQFTENNILTPKITGGKVKLNPLITILSIVAGNMIWGVPGMIVAVPYLGMFKIICDNVPRMKPLSILLGSQNISVAK